MRLIGMLVLVAAFTSFASPVGAIDGAKVSPGFSGETIEISANIKGAAKRPVAPVIIREGVDADALGPIPVPCFWQGPAIRPVQNICPVSVVWTTYPERDRAAAYAADYFRSLPLPVPVPKMSAPEGIAGARHQLDLQIPATEVYRDPTTEFGPLVVRVSGSFTVDWGDGNTDTFTSTGAPWPASELEHYWEDNARYDITVTAHWSATWSFGTTAGTLSGLTTTSTLPQWQVLEAQAVLIG